MPANRHRRRAQAARFRQTRAQAGPVAPPSATARLLQGGAGVVLAVIGIVLLATPQGAHTARGPAFLLLAGVILIGVAVRPR